MPLSIQDLVTISAVTVAVYVTSFSSPSASCGWTALDVMSCLVFALALHLPIRMAVRDWRRRRAT
jgi:hypothetical protein